MGRAFSRNRYFYFYPSWSHTWEGGCCCHFEGEGCGLEGWERERVCVCARERARERTPSSNEPSTVIRIYQSTRQTGFLLTLLLTHTLARTLSPSLSSLYLTHSFPTRTWTHARIRTKHTFATKLSHPLWLALVCFLFPSLFPIFLQVPFSGSHFLVCRTHTLAHTHSHTHAHHISRTHTHTHTTNATSHSHTPAHTHATSHARTEP